MQASRAGKAAFLHPRRPARVRAAARQRRIMNQSAGAVKE
jgi:hypothetical protein